MPPTRLVARHVSQLLFAREQRWRAVVPYDRVTHLVSGVVMGSSVAHLPYHDAETGGLIGIEDALRVARPVNAASISQSMGLATTTVRRSLNELVAEGRFVRKSAGYTVAASAIADPAFSDFVAADARALARTLAELARAGYAPAAGTKDAHVDALPAGVVQRVLSDFAIKVLETFVETYGGYADGSVEAAIVRANIDHLTADPELDQIYADDMAAPPDEVRRPVTVRALAKMLDLPFETVRRRVNALTDRDTVVWRDDGVVVPTRVLLSEQRIRHNRLNLAHFERVGRVITGLATSS